MRLPWLRSDGRGDKAAPPGMGRRLARRLTLAAGLLALPLLLSGCVVAPAPGYYAPPRASVYVAPRPYYAPYYRPYGYGGWYRPYGYGWGWRRW